MIKYIISLNYNSSVHRNQISFFKTLLVILLVSKVYLTIQCMKSIDNTVTVVRFIRTYNKLDFTKSRHCSYAMYPQIYLFKS